MLFAVCWSCASYALKFCLCCWYWSCCNFDVVDVVNVVDVDDFEDDIDDVDVVVVGVDVVDVVDIVDVVDVDDKVDDDVDVDDDVVVVVDVVDVIVCTIFVYVMYDLVLGLFSLYIFESNYIYFYCYLFSLVCWM